MKYYIVLIIALILFSCNSEEVLNEESKKAIETAELKENQITVKEKLMETALIVAEICSDNKIVDEITDSGFKMFLRPSMLFSPKPGYRDNERSAYIELINEMWTNRDVPKFLGEYGELADRFKKEIIDKLNK